MKTNIAVGKVDGETHPRLDWIYLDGSYNAHMTVLSLHKACHVRAFNEDEFPGKFYK